MAFETEIHNTIKNGKLFRENDVVAIAASGGKDSTVLAYVMKVLNERYKYGLNLVLLSIDEGITGELITIISIYTEADIIYLFINRLPRRQFGYS